MIRSIFILLLIAQCWLSCNTSDKRRHANENTTNGNTNQVSREDSLVYHSEDLEIRKISDHAYEHVSFLNTESFGKVPCNGMIVTDGKEAIVFDTPATGRSSEELIKFFSKKLGCTIKAVVATHFHEDCVGGLEEFHQNSVSSYANNLTLELLKKQNGKAVIPANGFDNSLELKVGDKYVRADFVGKGHTNDNIIGYFPHEHIMFGGCLIKEVGAGKGNLADADTLAWSATVRKIKQRYPQTVVVIPGHGKKGGLELLDYTIKLFE